MHTHAHLFFVHTAEPWYKDAAFDDNNIIIFSVYYKFITYIRVICAANSSRDYKIVVIATRLRCTMDRRRCFSRYKTLSQSILFISCDSYNVISHSTETFKTAVISYFGFHTDSKRNARR